MNYTLQYITASASIITSIAVIITIRQFIVSRKHLHLDTIGRCIDIYRNFIDLRSGIATDKIVMDYIDFVNEELFYFHYGYIPKEIALEWIDGILDYLPLFDNKGLIINESFSLERIIKNLNYFYKGYPRVKHCFTLHSDYEVEIAYGDDPGKKELKSIIRKNIVKEIYGNLGTYSFDSE